MKSTLVALLIASVLQIAHAQNQIGQFTPLSKTNPKDPQASESAWLNEAQRYIQKSEYYFKKFSAVSFAGANRAQQVVYHIQANGYSIEPVNFSSTGSPGNHWTSSFHMLSVNKGAASFIPNEIPSASVNNDHLIQHHTFFNVEYKNDENGLRQNFIINKKPVGNKNLEVKIHLDNKDLYASLDDEQTLKLKDKQGKTILRYDGLKVWDAKNNLLSAHMELNKKNTLEIIVNDSNAVYPVTIDPLNHTAEWTGTAVGILPTIINQTAIDAAYGYSVAGVGDVNGDGYADVAIGAPGLIDVISGTGTLASVGAVFVYYGSSNGLSTTPNAKLQPSTCVAGALFGFSIAGGDIDGDGKSDIIVGAPLDKVTISTGGSSTASGMVGKVYAFSGAHLTSSVTTPLLSLQLSGNGILEKGINLSVNALFGFSLAVTDDLNNDGLNDIIIGSPMYAGIKTGLFGSTVDVQSGAAFVFLSNGSGGYSLTKLNPPSTSLLGLGLLSANINGLLFGISVDGVGDYNGDGQPDIVVGAPAGVDLSSVSSLLTGQLLQGTATVYYGTGSGISTQPGATLVASAGGLLTNLSGTIANIANLFGYAVKGVRDAAGTHTGNILVGAPLGGTLTNLLGGLQVKTGTVSVFKRKSSSPVVSVTPDQQLSSPRNDNNILGLIQSSLLFGFSIDNVSDVNCDGIGDIIIGEPASSGAQLIGANVAGGSAYVFLGKSDGTYQSTPSWTATATYDATLGVNVTSLIGYSVAGAGKIKGQLNSNKILVGAPGRTLDFGTGLLNLGNTLGTLFGLVAGDNGVGKAYEFDAQLCGTPQSLPLVITQFNAVMQSNQTVSLSWQTTADAEVNEYVVQRSVDGVDWEKITTVAATHSTASTTNYTAVDENPYVGISYYRLQQVDISPEIFYSETREINNNEAFAAGVKITNPFTNSFTVRLNSLKENLGSMELFDINGKQINHQNIRVGIGVNIYQVNNLMMLSRGVYILHIINGTDNYTTKLVKQ